MPLGDISIHTERPPVFDGEDNLVIKVDRVDLGDDDDPWYRYDRSEEEWSTVGAVPARVTNHVTGLDGNVYWMAVGDVSLCEIWRLTPSATAPEKLADCPSDLWQGDILGVGAGGEVVVAQAYFSEGNPAMVARYQPTQASSISSSRRRTRARWRPRARLPGAGGRR